MSYENIKAALFCTHNGVASLADCEEFRERLSFLDKHIRYSRIYLETFRGYFKEGSTSLTDFIVPREKIEFVKKLFENKGIEVCGAVTTSGFGSGGRFRSFCYSSDGDRKALVEIIRVTASLFDEFILDDFYFTNCKCPSCIDRKGERSWRTFRLETMREVSRDLILKTARETNPDVKVIIKFPNWYEHYQQTGYDLEEEPRMFDKVYTGVETRDSVYTQQNTQKYLGYFLMRYLENLSGGKNGGGWLDTFDCRNRLDDYGSQILQTLLAKGREVTLFNLNLLLSYDPVFTPLAGQLLEELDGILPQLGNPVGAACYKPYHSSGEDYLHTYLGGIGIPLEPFAEYPQDAPLVFLSQSAAEDQRILEKIKDSLSRGADVIITSGLVRALQDSGLDELTGIRLGPEKRTVSRYARDMLITGYKHFDYGVQPVTFTELHYFTNDCFPEIAGMDHENSIPLLLTESVGTGRLAVLAVPDNPGDLYLLPPPVLDRIRDMFQGNLPARLSGTVRDRLYLYDNGSIVVQCGEEHNHEVALAVRGVCQLTDLVSGETLEGRTSNDETSFSFLIRPATSRFFRMEKYDQ